MHFRLVTATGSVLDEGEGAAEMIGDTLHVTPTFGQPLRLAPSDIAGVSEPEPYVVRLTLVEGPSLELTQLGRMRTQILAQLADARGNEVSETLLLRGVGKPVVFPGAVDARESEIRLYDDALVTTPAQGDGEKVPYPFIRGVTTDPSGYQISIEVAGREPMIVARLARRTSEFLNLLSDRHQRATGRTSHFLGALLPGLGPIALRGVAGLLRDGRAGSKADLDAIDETIWPALLAAATLPDRAAGVAELEQRGPMWLGFKQMVSVEREAEGVRTWTDSAVTPGFDHQGDASSFGGGLGGMMGAAVMSGGPPTGLGFNGPFQAMGSALALSMLGTASGGFGGGFGAGGSGFGGQHAIKPRADVQRGRLTPARTDYDAMSATDGEPTVLAFAFCHAGDYLVYEALNEPDHATYVYRARTASDILAVNRALDLVGFRVEGIYADASSAGSKYRKAAERLPALRTLRDAYVTRIIHTRAWSADLRKLG